MSTATKPQPTPKDFERMPIQIGRDLGKKVGIAARLDNKTKAQFAEEALEPVVAATFKRHGLKV